MRFFKTALLLCAAVVAPMLPTASHAQETIRIAFIEGLSGAFANVGEIGLRHYQLAAESVNAAPSAAVAETAAVRYENGMRKYGMRPSSDCCDGTAARLRSRVSEGTVSAGFEPGLSKCGRPRMAATCCEVLRAATRCGREGSGAAAGQSVLQRMSADTRPSGP